MLSIKKRSATILIVLLSFTMQACNTLSKKGDVNQVNWAWLKKNCETSDFTNSETVSASNCREYSAGSGYKAYECNFSSGTASGLYKLTDGKMDLLCGVNTDGVVYSDGSSDTSTLGKVLIGAAVIGAAVAIANSGGGGGGGSSYSSSCPCPYDTASDGSRCGARSAWSRSGGSSPYCDAYLLTTEDYLNKQ